MDINKNTLYISDEEIMVKATKDIFNFGIEGLAQKQKESEKLAFNVAFPIYPVHGDYNYGNLSHYYKIYLAMVDKAIAEGIRIIFTAKNNSCFFEFSKPNYNENHIMSLFEKLADNEVLKLNEQLRFFEIEALTHQNLKDKNVNEIERLYEDCKSSGLSIDTRAFIYATHRLGFDFRPEQRIQEISDAYNFSSLKSKLNQEIYIFTKISYHKNKKQKVKVKI